jgi:hypothetical protein
MCVCPHVQQSAATQPLAARRSSSEDEALAGMRLDESKLDEAEQKRLAGVSPSL